jgi:hypothetical protein
MRPRPVADASGSAPPAPEVQPEPSEPDLPAEPSEPDVPADSPGPDVPARPPGPDVPPEPSAPHVPAPAAPEPASASVKPEPTTPEPQRSLIDDPTQASPIPSPTAKEPMMSTAPTPTEPEKKTLIQKLIPQKTDPLGKFIRTGEGWLVFAFNLALLIAPIVSSSLSPKTAVEWAAILNGVTVVCRSGLKVAAVVGTPPSPVSQHTTSEVDAIAKELAQQLPELLDRGGAHAVPSTS